MLPKTNRLTSQELQEVVQKGRPFSSRFFYLKILPSKKGHTRFGVAVARALAHKSTEKNYYKRVLRSIIKETLPSFNASMDILIVLQKEARGVEYARLKKEARNLFSQAKIF